MQTVDIDLDGVVYPPFCEVLSDYIFERTGKRYQREASQWSFYLDWGIDLDTFNEFIRSGIKEGIIFGRGAPINGAVEGLRELDKLYRIRLVTHRLGWPGLHGAVQRNTASWLDKYQVPYHSIWYQGKNDIKNTDGVWLLDDKPDNVRTHRNGVLYRDTWNREEGEGLIVVETWADFVEIACG